MTRLGRFFRSLGFAWQGITLVFREEQSFRIQIAGVLVVLFLGIFFGVKKWEAVALILVASFVLVLELVNSTLERIVDYMKPRLHYFVEAVKDIMAGAVLVASVGAAIVGIVIFYPYMRALVAFPN